jgi:hypothetical protein
MLAKSISWKSTRHQTKSLSPDRANLMRTMDLTTLVRDRVLNLLRNSVSRNLQCLERWTQYTRYQNPRHEIYHLKEEEEDSAILTASSEDKTTEEEKCCS